MSSSLKRQDQLVEKAEALIVQLKDSGNWSGRNDLGRTQASRAIEVAQAADGLRLFVNWLRYQAARESERDQFWSLKIGQTTLAEALVADLNSLTSQEEDKMITVRFFLGYFRRALVGADWLDRIKV